MPPCYVSLVIALENVSGQKLCDQVKVRFCTVYDLLSFNSFVF